MGCGASTSSVKPDAGTKPSPAGRSASAEDNKIRGPSILNLEPHTISAVRPNPNNPNDHCHGGKHKHGAEIVGTLSTVVAK